MTGRRILIVDDDPALRQLASMTLLAEGFDVVQAANGKEAIAASMDARVDLVVLDNAMPDMNGCDVARALRENPQNERTPILMLSALVGDEDQWNGWRAGVDVYLTKPYDGDELLAHVHRLLR